MSVLKKLELVFPLIQFETPELGNKFKKIVEYLDRDMDEAGFDSSSTTDDAIERFIEELDNIENPIVIAIGSEDFIEDMFDEEEEAEDAIGDAIVLTAGDSVVEEEEIEEVIETVETVEIVTIEESEEVEEEDDEVALVDDDDDFENELNEETDEIQKQINALKETNAENGESKGDSTS